ncbi:MAG: tyrosinase family protein [Planctomycetota bacterium]
MKRQNTWHGRRLLLFAFLLTLPTLQVKAQERAQPPVAKSGTAADGVEAQLKELETKWATTVATNDPDQIGRFFTDDFLFVGAGGVLQDRQQHLEDFKTGLLKVESVTIKEFTVHAYQNYAVVNTLTHVEGKLGTRDLKGEYRFMDTWSHNGKQWLAVARQQTRVAAPPPTAGAHEATRQDLEKSVISPYRQKTRERYLEPKKSILQREAAKAVRSRVAARAALQAETIVSAAARVDVELIVDYTTVRIGQDDVRLRTYNEKLTGPVIRAKAGDTLYITLRNKLPIQTPTPHAPNSHHEWNTTNLHFHGLHVAPQGVPTAESDNIFVSLKPTTDSDGSVQKYEVRIPADHVAGTFWYHAHRHGGTAAQVASGMSGALIIERSDAVHNLNSVAAIDDAQEEILLLQQIPYLRDNSSLPGEIEQSPGGTGANEDEMLAPGAWGELGRYITVNGEKIPTITLAPGEIRRLRFIASQQREQIKLQIVRAPGTTGTGENRLKLHEIAVDGLPTGRIETKLNDTLDLFPGYRSDILIQPNINTTGEFYLVDNNAPAGTGADGSPEQLRWVAKIVITGAPQTKQLPTDAELFSHRLPDLVASPSTGTQYAFYGLAFPAGGGTNYFIYSKGNLAPGQVPTEAEFDPANARKLTLGNTDRWYVGTRNGANVGQFHPFHIHTNPFLITKVTRQQGNTTVDVTATEIGVPTWRDTLAMKQGYTYELLTRYDDFTGSFVNHCHILDHEDNGMMEFVQIEAAAPPAAPVQTGALNNNTNSIGESIPQIGDKPSVLFFVQGSLCPHCMTQLTEMATRLTDRKLQVAVVSASTVADLQSFPQVPFRLVADPELKLFKEYDAYDGKAKHATIVRDRLGRELLRKVGDEPFMDATAVLASLNTAAPRYVIAVRKTDDTKDDYVTWAPTPCQIRLENGTPGAADVTVTLTNDDAAMTPDGGDVRFAETLMAGQTATLDTITLVLKQDGTPVDFLIAGSKASKLTSTTLANGGRDAVIEIHEGGATGPKLNETAVMVRVRKNFAKLNETERTEFLKALAALRDMHVLANDKFEPFVRVHKLAAMGRAQGFDQAHMSSGFLPWHRAFLLLLEREMQKSHPHVALPYWLMDESPEHFTPSYLGNNYDPSTGLTQTEVILATSNPLYGWEIRFDSLGSLVRAADDHVRISNDAHYRAGASLESGSSGVYRNFRRLLEDDPHNIGHNNSGEWMAACVSSPADPLFWIFHCHHDHLWAHWQWTYKRFDATGTSSPDHYFPDNAYSSADPVATRKSFPLGHHLKDKMWPWDETHGQQTMGDPYTTRPAETFSKFPKAQLNFIWPSEAVSPKTGDMIDYWGLTPNTLSHGFAYDDTPFGWKMNPPVQIAALQEAAVNQTQLDVFLDGGASEANRLKAAVQLPIRDLQSHEAFETVLKDAKTSAAVKVKALLFLGKGAPDKAVTNAIELLGDKTSDAVISRAAIGELIRLHHIGELTDESRSALHSTIGNIAKAADRPAIQAEAVESLAQMGDPIAQPLLETMLRSPATSPIPLRKVVFLSRRYPGNFELIRPLLSSPQDELRIAALQALTNDVESSTLRTPFVEAKEYSPQVRRAAIRSVMSDSPAVLESLVKVALDTSELEETRAEAVAAIRVLVRRFKTDLAADRIRGATQALSSLRVVPNSEFGKTINLTLEAIKEVQP